MSRDTCTAECSLGGSVSDKSLFAKPSLGNSACLLMGVTRPTSNHQSETQTKNRPPTIRGMNRSIYWCPRGLDSRTNLPNLVYVGIRTAQSREAQFGTNKVGSKQNPKVNRI